MIEAQRKPPHSWRKALNEIALHNLSSEPQAIQSNLNTHKSPNANAQNANRCSKKASTFPTVSKPNVLRQYLCCRHRSNVAIFRLLTGGNVERNPGPQQTDQTRRKKPTVLVTTYNVRGLNDETKLRHLVNHLYKNGRQKDVDQIACVQETYISGPGKIPFLWRGNYFMTPGNGNSCGCITFLSSHLNIVASTLIEDRGHVIACQKSGEPGVSYIVANIYAPNPNTNAKIEFFEEVFNKVHELEERFNCNNTLILGDFNLTFNALEMKNRNYSTQEKRIASTVTNLMNGTGLEDIWHKKASFTWRRPNTDCFSTIDRILFSKAILQLQSCVVNWSLSFSDHAAVEAGFVFKDRPAKTRTRIPRIDPSLLKNSELSAKLKEGVEEMILDMPGNWDPHMKLEFLKVSIRTVAEKLQAERNRAENTAEEEIDEELNAAINVLGNGNLTEDRKNRLLDYVEELRIRKNVLIEQKGARLADRLGTKWYNEGEKSTRYFMRLLNRSNPDVFQKIQLDNGDIVEDEEKISEEVVKFYKNLYENFERIENTQQDQTFFNELNPIAGNDDEVTNPITIEELRATLDSCVDSAPGPD